MAMVFQQAGITTLADDGTTLAAETAVTESATEAAETNSDNTSDTEAAEPATFASSEETTADTAAADTSASTTSDSNAKSTSDTDAAAGAEADTSAASGDDASKNSSESSNIEETPSDNTQNENDNTAEAVTEDTTEAADTETEEITEAVSESGDVTADAADSEDQTEAGTEAADEADALTDAEGEADADAAESSAEASEADDSEAAQGADAENADAGDADAEDETEAETETETEAEAPKTSFSYSDSRVVITATATVGANLPQGSELMADYIEPGTDAYNEAVSQIESQLGSTLGLNDENVETAYVLYDVYFLYNGERIEPEDGTVSVSMVFRSAVDLGLTGEIVGSEVVHVKDSGEAEVVTDYVNVNANGDVTAMGFTQDSFSTTGAIIVTQDNTSTTNNNDLITGISGYYYSGTEQIAITTGTYIPSDTSTFYVNLTFAFGEGTLTAENPTLTFDVSGLLDLGTFGESSGTVFNDSKVAVGTYTISADGIITITYDTSKIDVTGAVSGYVDFGITASEDLKENADGASYTINGQTITLKYDTSDLTVGKVGEVSEDYSTATYTITIESTNGTNEDVTVTDPIPTYLKNITYTVVKYTSLDADGTTIYSEVSLSGNDLSLVLDQMSAGDKYVITVTGDLTLAGDYTNLQNTVTVVSDSLYKQAYSGLNVSLTHIAKEGKLSDDGTYITWTVTVNQAKQDITGYTLSDSLGDISNVTITYEGQSEPFSTSLPYKFDGSDLGDANGKCSYEYTVTYTTPVTSAAFDTKVTNTATLTNSTGDKSWSDGGSATVPGLPDSEYDITKTSTENGTDSGTGNQIVKWTVEVAIDTTDSSSVTIPSGTEITDNLSSGSRGSLYMTKAQLQAMTLKDSTGNEYSFDIVEVSTYTNGWTGSNISLDDVTDDHIVYFKIATSEEITLEDGAKLYLVYDSIVNATSSMTLYNYVVFGSWKATGSYVYEVETELEVTKRASDSSANTLSDTELDYYKNGDTLYWTIAVGPGLKNGDVITITDVLPEGLTYAGSYTLRRGNETSKWDGIYHNCTVEYDPETRTLTIKITATYDDNNDAIYITYATTFDIDDWDENTTAKVYENSISYTVNDGDKQTESASQTVELTDITKVGSVGENSDGVTTLDYTVYVNSKASDLSDGDTITLTDVLTPTSSNKCTIELDNASIKVTDTSGNELSDDEWSCTISTDESTGITTITLTLPDEKALIVTYEYTIWPSNGATASLVFGATNTAIISGSYDISDSDSESGSAKYSSAGSNTTGITIHKVAKGHNNKNLEGTVFYLYKYNDSTGEFDYVSSYETDENGKATIKAIDTKDWVYKLVEETATDGYDLLTAPIYFYIPDSSTSINGADAVTLAGGTLIAYTEGITVQLENKASTGGTLKVTKNVVGTEDNTDGYTVTVKSDSTEANWDEVYAVSDGKIVTLTKVMSDDNSRQVGVSFTIKSGETVTLCEMTLNVAYTVEEASGQYITTYAGFDDNVETVTFTDKNTKEVTITNTFSSTPTSAEIEATKAIEGSPATDSTFTFNLYDSNGDVI
ncbi:MAG: hypothetical protein LUI87_03370, partial [Lachnospiraceae bacterium]|nr:hypothetical protein [Lachnospiraceae bacterium]